ncbi:MAG TPA: alpha-amylase/4-alpha-glucanotransferase domain-containing protein [Candidatus Acidoferrales bacterium]|nr:alpha-amylase/4-alpha-glucanotransferase domain-containing protein [Candidatus Acidoferrales bacterium]
MSRFHLVLVIHGHQPVGNFDDVFERCYRKAYLPFFDLLERHPAIRLGFHLSGPVWEWLSDRHPEYFTLLKALVARGQVELLGGAFYEPILIAIPPADRIDQIARMTGFLFEQFGVRPEGLWLAERVWEPHLVDPLEACGVGYTLVDDNLFLMAGLEPGQLFGYYRVEELGAGVDVFPGLQSLRYLIPYRPVDAVMEFLRRSAGEHPGGMAAMGDDLEKFGVWPGTYDHVYTNGWLERLFAALEANGDWLATTPPGDYRREHPALGRAAVSAGAYREMMEWALPALARPLLESLAHEFAGRPDALRFLSGGPWRNFLVKYPEARLLAGKMRLVSRRLSEREDAPARGERGRLAKARIHLMRAQCNDAYWHGIFGGVYAPHLRDALWRELIAAERLLDTEHPEPRSESIPAGGQQELHFASERYGAILHPADGATIAALNFRSAGAALIDSMARRPEAYHSRLTGASSAAPGGAVSIHELVRAKEPGLERLLRYDRWLRHCFRLLLFPATKRPADYSALLLEENPELAAGRYDVERLLAGEAELSAAASVDELAGRPGVRVLCQKSFRFLPIDHGFAIRSTVRLSLQGAPSLTCRAGYELVLNFLALDTDDRYFSFGAERRPLGWEGVVPGAELKLFDHWQKIAAAIASAGAEEYWIAPIETVSESEEGFERVYQGSQILPVWPVTLSATETWEGNVELRFTTL